MEVRKYRALTAIGGIIMGLGWFVVIMSILLAGGRLLFSTGASYEMIVNLAILLGGVAFGLILAAAGELIKLLIDIEGNTRESAILLRDMKDSTDV